MPRKKSPVPPAAAVLVQPEATDVVRVRMVASRSGAQFRYRCGDVPSLPAALAEQFIKEGAARPIGDRVPTIPIDPAALSPFDSEGLPMLIG
jgi:hypothetical protein